MREMTNMRYIYVLLTRSGTVYSRFIRAVTGDEYTHVSLGLGCGAESLYSFSRKRAHLPLPSPIVREDVAGSYLSRHPRMRCALYRIPVSREKFESVRRRVEGMYAERGRYHYSLLGAALCKLDIAHERAEHYFCSQFVAEVLGKCGVVELPKNASLMRPADFARLPELELIYTGTISHAPGAEDLFTKGASDGQAGEVRAV